MKKLFYPLSALFTLGSLVCHATPEDDCLRTPQPPTWSGMDGVSAADELNEVIGEATVDRLSLAGKWNVTLNDDGETGDIALPGTLDEALLGQKVNTAAYGCLSRRFNYIGPAVYTRLVTIPKCFEGQNLELYLERVMWQSKISVDSIPVGKAEDSLAGPHIHRLGKLSPGKHFLTIEINNRMIHRLGEKSHAYGEHMQTLWNGAIGNLEIRPVPLISEVRADAPYPANKLTLSFKGPKARYQVTLSSKSPANREPFTFNFDSVPGKNGRHELVCLFKDHMPLPWNEFTPNLYTVKIKMLISKTHKSVWESEIGFRTLERRGNRIFMNGKPLFARGNLDNCHFPLTGYPAMDKDQWLRIFRISKANGINMIRFHSWCPPQAAFAAANEMGLYLAPEAGMWIDSWMPVDPDGKKYLGLGQGDADLDAFIHSELNTILSVYGNDPSFTMLCIGNELGNSNFEVLGKWMADLKATDSRRLYSASTARSVTPADDYMVTHSYPGVGGVRQRMESNTNWDYEGQFKRADLPVIAHEIGQWPIYPDWDEIKKYTGILRPWNLEKLRDEAKAKGVFRFNKEFHFASAMQNKMMYKDEIESFMRTPSCAGLQLLGMQDYAGQGEALVGWLNSFYEEKGGLTAKETRAFFAPSVLLARFPKYVWTPSETFEAKILRHHGGLNPAQKANLSVGIYDAGGLPVNVKLETMPSQPVGSIEPVANYSFPLKGLAPGRYTLRTEGIPLSGTEAETENQWPLWIFPDTISETVPENVVFTEDFQTAFSALQAGKRVVLDASRLGAKGKFLPGSWGAVYWSTTWFPGQAMKTLGLWLDKESPLFAGFGCEGFGDWVWRDLCAGGRAFKLDGLPADYRPTAMPVPDFHINERLGTLFELKIGKGSLLVSGYDLRQKIPQSRQLKANILRYVSGKDFHPGVEVDSLWLEQTFSSEKKGMAPRPEKFKNAQIYIECSGKLNERSGDIPWEPDFDRAELNDAFKYRTHGITHWHDSNGDFWVLRKESSNFTLEFPSGDTGKLFVRFRDPNRNNRIGKGTFEGRPFTVPLHGHNPNGEYWAEFDVDREDSLDGKLEFHAEPTQGPNLMIDRVIYQSNQKQ